jgi:hypothetical protein
MKNMFQLVNQHVSLLQLRTTIDRGFMDDSLVVDQRMLRLVYYFSRMLCIVQKLQHGLHQLILLFHFIFLVWDTLDLFKNS